MSSATLNMVKGCKVSYRWSQATVANATGRIINKLGGDVLTINNSKKSFRHLIFLFWGMSERSHYLCGGWESADSSPLTVPGTKCLASLWAISAVNNVLLCVFAGGMDKSLLVVAILILLNIGLFVALLVLTWEFCR